MMSFPFPLNPVNQVPTLNCNSNGEVPALFKLSCGLQSCIDNMHNIAFLLCGELCLIISLLTRDGILATLES